MDNKESKGANKCGKSLLKHAYAGIRDTLCKTISSNTIWSKEPLCLKQFRRIIVSSKMV